MRMTVRLPFTIFESQLQNAKRSHAGATAFECNRDGRPALAAASG
jgi:hypothetical protein